MNAPATDLFTLGLSHHRAGRHNEADRYYVQAIEADPACAEALLNLAGLRIAAGRHDEAESYLDDARQIRPNDPSIVTALANVQQSRGNHDAAEALYREAIALDPSLALAHANLGRLLYTAGRHEEAVTSYLAALELDPTLAAVHANLGAALVSMGRLDDAERSLTMALELSPTDPDLHLNLGHIRFAREDYDGAAAHFSEASNHRLGWAKAHQNLGAALHRKGQYVDAEREFRRAALLEPENPEARRGLGTALISLERLDEAEEQLLRCDALVPGHPQTQFLLGQVFASSEDFERAATYFQSVVETVPGLLEARLNLGHALQVQHHHTEALEQFEAAVAIDDKSSQAFNNLGNSLAALNRVDEAIDAYRRALELEPDLTVAHINLGNTLRQIGRHAEGMASFTKAMELDPEDPRALNGLGLAYQAFNRQADAVEVFKRAIAVDDTYPEAMNNLAIAYQQLGQYHDSIATYNELIKKHPQLSQAYFNLGSLLQLLSRHDEAVTAFREALNRNVDNNVVYPYLAHGLMQQCSWDNLEAIIARVIENTEREIERGAGVSISPFGLQSLPASPELRLQTARHVAKRAAREVQDSKKRLGALTYKPKQDGKLKIGFISPDFRFHSVAVAFRGVLESRDTDRYHYGAYAVTTYGQDDLTRYFSETFDSWCDITRMSYTDTVQRMVDDGVNVLIDLAGHTRGGRPEILALRPAPVQAHWLGFSSTTGADYTDYLITDRVQLPPEDQKFCTEKLVYLPDTFMATSRPPVAVETYTRADFGLPDNGFVFANFNSHYKFYPTLFAIWMRMLRQIPGSVLWLMSGTKTSRKNLRNEAAARGIDPERLVFSDTIAHPRHLSRLPLADLGLDNLHHGGGVTTTDALWAGVPVLTLYGETPPSRNGATLVHAIGAPELIAYSQNEYEKKALAYARNPELLAALRAKLKQNRDIEPLFDIKRLTRHFENACDLMWARYEQGLSPDVIEVPALARS